MLPRMVPGVVPTKCSEDRVITPQECPKKPLVSRPCVSPSQDRPTANRFPEVATIRPQTSNVGRKTSLRWHAPHQLVGPVQDDVQPRRSLLVSARLEHHESAAGRVSVVTDVGADGPLKLE